MTDPSPPLKVVNATMMKFGYPASLVAETDYWSVLVRPQQPTLGALALICHEPVTAFGKVGPAAMLDLGRVTAAIETMLAHAVRYQKINYLMLMMVDPDVHFHVIPRYEGERAALGLIIADHGWPGPPVLGQATALAPAQIATMAVWLRGFWPEGAA
jgi:diadenosine tetraphosphate (Ap4A) HIT family hydrolase